jgi:hypothetical protein
MNTTEITRANFGETLKALFQAGNLYGQATTLYENAEQGSVEESHTLEQKLETAQEAQRLMERLEAFVNPPARPAETDLEALLTAYRTAVVTEGAAKSASLATAQLCARLGQEMPDELAERIRADIEGTKAQSAACRQAIVEYAQANQPSELPRDVEFELFNLLKDYHLASWREGAAHEAKYPRDMVHIHLQEGLRLQSAIIQLFRSVKR